jgi:hypothetical protein
MKLLLSLIQGSFFESNGPTYLVVVSFILLGIISAALITPLIRLFLKHTKISFFFILSCALLGGFAGILMHVYARQYLECSMDLKPASLVSTFGLLLAFLFANMLAFSLLAGIIWSQREQIRALEKEKKEKLK